jgi:Flp pilus assembly protein TadG
VDQSAERAVAIRAGERTKGNAVSARVGGLPHGPGAPTRGERGQFALELALLAPLLLVLIFLTFEFGRVFGSWLVITNAAREGARYSITQQWCGPTNATTCSYTTTDSNIVTRVSATAEYLSPSGTQSCTPSGSGTNTPAAIGTCGSCPASKLCVGIYRYVDANSNKVIQVWSVYQVQTLTPIAGAVPFVGTVTYPSSLNVIGHTSMRSQR